MYNGITEEEYERLVAERKRRDEAFRAKLKAMTDIELAEVLERGGTVVAPNPHYVIEAARRLKERAFKDRDGVCWNCERRDNCEAYALNKRNEIVCTYCANYAQVKA